MQLVVHIEKHNRLIFEKRWCPTSCGPTVLTVMVYTCLFIKEEFE